jgi:molybdenum cofactor biosynthesis enzyme MoaA
VIAASSVCLRVTRVCNARCDFCLAPPDGRDVPLAAVLAQIDWLASEGVRKVHVCGGEPTVRNDLPQIIGAIADHGMASAMTTNAIRMPRGLPAVLATAGTAVKVSLHGPPAAHENMLGRRGADRVERHIGVLRDAGARVSIQTVVSHRFPGAYLYVAEFCLDHGIGKLTLIPFIPRGRGAETAGDHALAPAERRQLAADVLRLRGSERALDVRVLDFVTKDYFVVETDGRLMIQRETEAADSVLAGA